MHTVYHQGAGAGGRVSPHAHSPWLPPILSQTYHSYTPRRSRHTWGRLLYGEADSIPHEEEGGGWDMLDMGCVMQEEAGICWTGDAECGEGGGWAGM